MKWATVQEQARLWQVCVCENDKQVACKNALRQAGIFNCKSKTIRFDSASYRYLAHGRRRGFSLKKGRTAFQMTITKYVNQFSDGAKSIPLFDRGDGHIHTEFAIAAGPPLDGRAGSLPACAEAALAPIWFFAPE
jgi:hypothetical protein